MTYGRGLGVGMMISLFTGILFCLFVYTFSNFFDASILQMQKDDVIIQMQAIDENKDTMVKIIGEKKFDESMEALQKAHDEMTMAQVAGAQFEVKLFGGLLVSLIAAGFLKKKRSVFDDFTNTSPPSPPAPPTNATV
jgi:hypothetical protein